MSLSLSSTLSLMSLLIYCCCVDYSVVVVFLLILFFFNAVSYYCLVSRNNFTFLIQF